MTLTPEPKTPGRALNFVYHELDAVQTGNLGDAERCNRCGGENVVWYTPSPLWNLVMRANAFDGTAQFGDLVCMRCFVVLAEEVGVGTRGAWRLTADPEPDGLLYTTPDGRVWDETQFRWVDPQRPLPEEAE